MRKIGERLIGEKRETALHAKDWQGDRRQRDLLTLLIQGNTDPSIPDSERLTDEEILAREFQPSLVTVRSLTKLLEIPT